MLAIRQSALIGFRRYHESYQFIEVTPSSLVNIAGSCENPYASFKVNYYGREAHLSQSAQLQLEALLLRRLGNNFFTVNNSFREEHYDDPESAGRRLSEFTLIEAETSRLFLPKEQKTPDEALRNLISFAGGAIHMALSYVLLENSPEFMESKEAITSSQKNIWKHLYRTLEETSSSFETITYDDALEILNNKGGSYKFGDDLGIKEERKILAHFDNMPVAVIHHPASLKFFNIKRTPDGQHTYSFDILLPPLGETVGGGLREENKEKIKQQLLESKVASYILEKKQDPLQVFGEYLSLFEQEEPLIRGGYGIGFERFIGFLLNSNDILNTIAYRTLRPEGDKV